MPLLRQLGPRTYERDPFARRKLGEYSTPGPVPGEIEYWYTQVRGRSDERTGDVPEGYEVVGRKERDGLVGLLLMHTGDDYCVELTYQLRNGVEVGHRARAVPPEIAYRYALERDEKMRARGTVIYNERHPREAGS